MRKMIQNFNRDVHRLAQKTGGLKTNEIHSPHSLLLSTQPKAHTIEERDFAWSCNPTKPALGKSGEAVGKVESNSQALQLPVTAD